MNWGIIETISGALTGFGDIWNYAFGVLGIIFIFLVSQLIFFGQIFLIGWLFIKTKEFLEKSEIIPKAKSIFKATF